MLADPEVMFLTQPSESHHRLSHKSKMAASLNSSESCRKHQEAGHPMKMTFDSSYSEHGSAHKHWYCANSLLESRSIIFCVGEHNIRHHYQLVATDGEPGLSSPSWVSLSVLNFQCKQDTVLVLELLTDLLNPIFYFSQDCIPKVADCVLAVTRFLPSSSVPSSVASCHSEGERC